MVINGLVGLSSEDSVFKAKSRRRETVGVAEIQEDGQLTVDLPIDQVTWCASQTAPYYLFIALLLTRAHRDTGAIWNVSIDGPPEI